MLHRYKCLDDYGRQAVDAILAIEYERAFSVQPKKSRARLLKIDYYSTPASAGTGNFLESETPEQILVKETPEAERADLVIRIVGDSMEPTFHNNDKVFVEKCDAIREGEIGIFIINGDAFIKELGNDCLISHNSAYQPIKLTDNDSIYCCGRVLGIVEN
jgi:phage repressor protein C with HTH and peptisase S24 domain